MYKPKLILHAGSSKKGSSALQATLSKKTYLLASNNKQVLVVSGTQNDLYSEDPAKISFLFETSINCNGHYSISLGPFYEVYRHLRINRDLQGLRVLWDNFFSSLLKFAGSKVDVVLSAEAFEIPFCLRDRLFRLALLKLKTIFNISVVFYKANTVSHMISSWLEFGWRKRYSFSQWLVQRKNTENSFYRGYGSEYLVNLYEYDWVDYWKKVGINFLFFENVENVVEHFFLDVMQIEIGEYPELSVRDANIGWPKNCIKYYPGLFELIDGDQDVYYFVKNLLLHRFSGVDDSDHVYEKLTDMLVSGDVVPAESVDEVLGSKIDDIFLKSESHGLVPDEIKQDVLILLKKGISL